MALALNDGKLVPHTRHMVERADRDTDVVGVLARAEANEAVHQEPLARRQAQRAIGMPACQDSRRDACSTLLVSGLPERVQAGIALMAPKIAPP